MRDNVQTLIETIQELFDKGNLDEASKQIETLLQKRTLSPEERYFAQIMNLRIEALRGNLDQSKSSIRQVIYAISPEKHPFIALLAHTSMSSICWRAGDLKDALNEVIIAEELLETIKRKPNSPLSIKKMEWFEAELLRLRGIIYWDLGKLDEALDCAFKSLRTVGLSEKKTTKEKVLILIGIIYLTRGEYHQAEVYLQRAIEQAEERGSLVNLAVSLNDLGLTYRRMGYPERALELHERAMNINESLGLKQEIAFSLYCLGETYYALSQYDKAYRFFSQSLEIRGDIGNQLEIAHSLFKLTLMDLETDKIDDARSRNDQLYMLWLQSDNVKWIHNAYVIIMSLLLGKEKRFENYVQRKHLLLDLIGTNNVDTTIYEQALFLLIDNYIEEFKEFQNFEAIKDALTIVEEFVTHLKRTNQEKFKWQAKAIEIRLQSLDDDPKATEKVITELKVLEQTLSIEVAKKAVYQERKLLEGITGLNILKNKRLNEELIRLLKIGRARLLLQSLFWSRARGAGNIQLGPAMKEYASFEYKSKIIFETTSRVGNLTQKFKNKVPKAMAELRKARKSAEDITEIPGKNLTLARLRVSDRHLYIISERNSFQIRITLRIIKDILEAIPWAVELATRRKNDKFSQAIRTIVEILLFQEID